MNLKRVYAKLADVDIDRQFVWYQDAMQEWHNDGCPYGEYVYRVPDTNIELVIHSDHTKNKYALKIWRIRLWERPEP